MKKIIYLIFSLVILLISFTLIYFINNEYNRKYLKVVFLDVGQGDAIYIEAPNGKQVLIDGGESSVVVRELSKILPFYDRSIDMLIATHFDNDHVGGFPDIFRRYVVGMYATSDRKDDSGLYFELEKLSEKEKSERLVLGSGDIVVLDEELNIQLDVLWPPKDREIENRNNSSIVVRLVYGETSFLFTGDIGKEEELELLNMEIESDVLKLGHHGSKHSSSESFIFKVEPMYSIVSAGEGNKFGHPSQEVIDLLNKNKTEVLETSVLGSIIFKSDGNQIELLN